MVKINGIYTDEINVSVQEYLEKANYNLLRVAVEINGEIVPKSMYESTILKDGDTVEVVSFVGGG